MDPQTSRHRDIVQQRLADHVALGHAERHFFAHRIRHLRRSGPDGLQLSSRMCRLRDPDALWEIAIHALPPAIERFPEELFFDQDLNWHQRHLGVPGLVGSASAVVHGRTAWTLTYLSDLVQRSSRRPDYRSQIDNRFKGWTLWLLNAVIDFARERGCTEVRSPTADLVLRHTDPARVVQPEIYRRIYDRSVTRWFEATRQGSWWILNVAQNASRIVTPEPGGTDIPPERTICVCHDIERGLGHRDVDPELAARADRTADASLAGMLDLERSAGVKATYNVLGCLLPDVRGRIEADGHALGFHSYDHSIDRWWPVSQWGRRIRRRLLGSTGAARHIDQLTSCREVDYRIRGYRPPQSRITRELGDANLCWHNFEWFASSTHSLHVEKPALRHRMVRIPILTDDHSLYTRKTSWPDWEAHVLHEASRRDFTALSLHDCYADLWLPHYAAFLERLQRIGRLVTLDEVAAHQFLTTAA
jgi:peptidoglycan/xylan/chitin deacetylase (PgdA/CDA1 family)